MSETAVVCPHCGSRQADRDPRQRSATPAKPAEPLELSKDEVAALFSVRGADVMDFDEPRGPLALIFPAPDATGWGRVVEWALTVVAAPLLVPGFVFALFRLRFFGNQMMRASEATLTLAIGTSGALSVWSLAALAGWGSTVTAAVVGGGVGALTTRLFIRRRRRRRAS